MCIPSKFSSAGDNISHLAYKIDYLCHPGCQLFVKTCLLFKSDKVCYMCNYQSCLVRYQLFSCNISARYFFFNVFIPPPQNVGGIMDSLCRARPSVHRSVSPSVRPHYRVCSKNPIPIEGFSSNLADIFISTRGCAVPMLPFCRLNVRVTLKGQELT